VIEAVGVVVPAHDEQDFIGDCVAALAANRIDLPVRIVVVLDDCSDRTAERTGTAETVTVPFRCVGAARAAGVEHLLTTSDVPPRNWWLASTDADTRVPAGWLAGMLALAAEADLVLGTALPDDCPVYPAWRRRHSLADGHRHVHGANLGIRGDAYRAIGGWPALATGEDVELARRAVAAGQRVRRTAAIPVRTSARTVGRAPDGFAAYLALLEQCDVEEAL
jgi:GT2 family glycosyltransferase